MVALISWVAVALLVLVTAIIYQLGIRRRLTELAMWEKEVLILLHDIREDQKALALKVIVAANNAESAATTISRLAPPKQGGAAE